MVVQEKILQYPLKMTGEIIEAYNEHESIWLSTEAIAKLYETPLHIVLRHIKMIYAIDSMSEFLTMQRKRMVKKGREQLISYYNLQMIVAIGTQLQATEMPRFYKWAVQQLND